MIGATAIIKGYAIATRDKQRFPKIPGLKASRLRDEGLDQACVALAWVVSARSA